MKKILLIEDNKNMRENTMEILSLANYQVCAAENGKSGVKMAIEEKPDLIICDIMMPELDGYGVLYMLSQHPSTAGIPFIFLTAKTEKADIRKGMSLGADDYLTKPFDGMDLLATIEMRFKKNDLFKRDFSRNINGLNDFFTTAKGIEELKQLSASRRPHVIKKKEIIYLDGDEAKNVIFINRGKVKISKMNKDGKEFITGLYQGGDFIGTLDMIENTNYKETAVAMEQSEIMLIPKQDFYALIYSNRDVAARFIHFLSNNIEEMEERLLSVAFNSVRKRVAESLIRIKKKYTDENQEEALPVTRTDLANVIGVAPETVSRTLADFKSEHLIEFIDKQIKIINPEKLINMKD
jgi:CRP-like cAMP-binding protein